MKSAHVLAGVLVGTLLGCGLGYLIGIRQGPEINDAPAANPSTQQPTEMTTKRGEREIQVESSGSAVASSSTATVRPDARSFRDQLHDIAAIKSDVKCTYEAERLFERLTLAELPDAFAQVQALPPSASRSRMLGMLFKHWGSLDGPAALAAAAQLGAREKWSAESKALEGWAKANPEAAWNAAREMISGNYMSTWRVHAAMREFSRVDLARAMDQAVAISSENGRSMLRSAIIDAAVEDGRLESVVRQAMQLENLATRETWVRDVFSRWGSLDTDAPMAALRNITDPALAQSAMTGFVTGWSELDPRGAFDYVLENRSDPLVSRALGPVINAAIRYGDESEVRTMMAEVVERGAYAGVSSEVGMQVAQFYPALALELAGSLTDENQRNRQTSMALSSWARNDFKAAAAYFEAMPNSPAKASAFSTMSYQTLRQDGGPAALARWLNGFSGQERMRAAQSLIGQQANQPAPLKPADAAALAQAVAATPGLPPEVLERAKKLFGPAPAP